MGYYSDVRMIMSKDGFDHFNDLVAECEKEAHCEPCTMNHLSIYDMSSNGLVYFGWDFIKWYPGMGDIGALEAALKRLAKDEYSYRFARLGEEIGDLETDYFDGYKDEKRLKDVYTPSVRWYFNDEYNIDEMNYAGGQMTS